MLHILLVIYNVDPAFRFPQKNYDRPPKHLSSWNLRVRTLILEFCYLCRYIPVGVLERLPQRINEKPPYYIGRDDLETTMASANCADWIKIRSVNSEGSFSSETKKLFIQWMNREVWRFFLI